MVATLTNFVYAKHCLSPAHQYAVVVIGAMEVPFMVCYDINVYIDILDSDGRFFELLTVYTEKTVVFRN